MLHGNVQSHEWPQSILIVGCGLLGTSLAMRWRIQKPELSILGVEANAENRGMAMGFRIFDDVCENIPASQFDVAVLCTPVDAAVELLPVLQKCAKVVMDICSVKSSICRGAEAFGMQAQFAPTHPMAGLATGGPQHATSDLFEHRPWIVLDGWSAVSQVVRLIESTGAYVVAVRSASEHDEAMSVVSHAVHVVSLSTMRAYHAARSDLHAIAQLTGPAFRDVTRLSASPPGFWVSTLLENREHVMAHIHRVQCELSSFEQALRASDATRLHQLLDESQNAFLTWVREHERES